MSEMNLKNEIRAAQLEAAQYSMNAIIAEVGDYLSKNNMLEEDSNPLTQIYRNLINDYTKLDDMKEDEIENLRFLCRFLKRSFI